MTVEEKKKLLLDFINGPLQKYLQGDISFGKFKELINSTCGTDFTYSDLYPSYLFNAILTYEEDECLEVIPNTFAMCGEYYGDTKQYCSKHCLENSKEKP